MASTSSAAKRDAERARLSSENGYNYLLEDVLDAASDLGEMLYSSDDEDHICDLIHPISDSEWVNQLLNPAAHVSRWSNPLIMREITSFSIILHK